MKISLCLYFLLIALFIGCVSENTNKIKASQILKEIDAISVEHRKNGQFDEVMNVSKNFGEKRKDFPNSKDELKQDAKFLKDYFEKEIEKNNQVKEKFGELLNLTPASSEADCIKLQVKSLDKKSEKIRLSVSDFDLFLDENIKDRETLEAKSRSIKVDIGKIDSEIMLLEEENSLKCGRKK